MQLLLVLVALAVTIDQTPAVTTDLIHTTVNDLAGVINTTLHSDRKSVRPSVMASALPLRGFVSCSF